MAIQDEIMAIFQNPAILASLQNTMGPAGGIQSQADAAVQQQQADLAAKTQAAAQASTAAGTQYQQAAAAPQQATPERHPGWQDHRGQRGRAHLRGHRRSLPVMWRGPVGRPRDTAGR